MKKRIVAGLLCCVLLVCCGCNAKDRKFKRISFNDASLSETVKCITVDTVVTYTADETFQTQMPIYEISRHPISEQEFQKMEEQLGIGKWHWSEFDGYTVYGRLAPYSDPERGYFSTLNMTDDDLEMLAWETFHNIPFLEGDFEYAGKTATMSGWTMDQGEFITEVTVSFYRRLDGVCVVGNEQCDLTFDASGLVEIYISMYDYQEIETMDMISLTDAQSRIKEPDYFGISDTSGAVKELRVDRVQTYLVNQFANDCTILQPIYTFYGTAEFENGDEQDFKSRVIAIPEELTYEE